MTRGAALVALGVAAGLVLAFAYLGVTNNVTMNAAEQRLGQLEAECLQRDAAAGLPTPAGHTAGELCRQYMREAVAALHYAGDY